MSQKRIKGYVSSVWRRGKKVLFQVTVKDANSSYDGRQLSVASVQNEVTLARGINVHFVIATRDNQNSKKVLCALDVCPESP